MAKIAKRSKAMIGNLVYLETESRSDVLSFSLRIVGTWARFSAEFREFHGNRQVGYLRVFDGIANIV
jgi:hypothetical protein